MTALIRQSLLHGVLVMVAWLLTAATAHAVLDAQTLFQQSQQQVYQIRVIDLGSGDKSSIGSGFLISNDGYIATNFHVVSSYVHEPDKFRLEFVNHKNQIADSRLMGIDVIHDLAILKADISAGKFLPLNDEPLSQGERLFSMGNPRDLGMTIIEGTNNGLVKRSRHKRILFSGSLNPGMSGGPAMNRWGEVIGINVSKGGEQLSFLVPVVNLKKLLEDVQANVAITDFDKAIQAALYTDQDVYFQSLIKEQYEQESFGGLRVPVQLSEKLNCWGHTLDDKDMRHESFHQHCRLEDNVFIRDDFYTGDFFYDYEWLEIGELNSFQFYHALTKRFQANDIANARDKEYVTNFACHTDFVNLSGRAWKVTSCLREYREYPALFDATMIMASVDDAARAGVVSVGASGISLDNAQALFGAFMRSVQWQ